jgi:hypothetical protein
MNMRLCSVLLSFTLLLSASATAIENTIPAVNSEPAYVLLRQIQLAGGGYEVHNLKIVRDAGTFELHSGTLCLLAPVQGMVTGAVFHGSGSFNLKSDDPREQNQMRRLTGGPGLSEDFEKLVLRFADGSPEEITKSAAVKPSTTGCPVDYLQDTSKETRFPLRYNLSGRLLQPVLAAKPDGFFMAFVSGKKYSDRMIFVVDPQGVGKFLTYGERSTSPEVNVSPDQVTMFTYSDMKFGIWYSGPLLNKASTTTESHISGPVRAVHQNLDVSFDKGGFLNGVATTTFAANIDGLRVVPLDLFWKLRTDKVTDGSGSSLPWIQEEKHEDMQYFVILPKPLSKGEQYTVKTTYSGKDAVTHEGSGNYYPAARENWYPNTCFGDYATYEMTLRIPKGNTMAATGTLVSSATEGSQNVSVWKSDVPLAVAGFNFGEFKQESVTLDKIGVTVGSFVNKEPPDKFKDILAKPMQIRDPNQQPGYSSLGGNDDATSVLGSLSTTPLLKKALGEGQLATQLYTDYFGPMSYKSVRITQQTATNYGQSWPGLVFMPITYFLDTTQRNAFGWNENNSYFRTVEPHEVAHQWWGHTVGFNSYRDQWMSEGFAEFSASLYVQLVRNNRQEYLNFWKDERRMLLEKNQYGVRAIDAGPLTLGVRVNSGRQGYNIYRELIYTKGAFVLHMLRMMMYSPKTGDADFKAMMQDLVNTYRNKPVSTEEFKAMVEKHLTPAMNAAGDGKMNWFFDEWVYGTEIPSYSVDTTNETGADGKGAISLRVTQSGVSPNFRMVVPVYFELNDGKIGKLGQVLLVGNQTITQKISLGATVPKRLMINYNYDVLSAN